MDARVLLVTGDEGWGALLRAQVENLGCRCSMLPGVDEAVATASWADVAILDLLGTEVASIERLRRAAPGIRVLAVAPDDDHAERAADASVEGLVVEPFSIPELVAAFREVAAGEEPAVVDLRGASAVEDEQPWWATR